MADDDDIGEDIDSDESAVWVLWGRYERAKLLAVQQGMYNVQFEADGCKRWATVMELALPEHKLSASTPLALGMTVLLKDGDGYVHGTLKHAPLDAGAGPP